MRITIVGATGNVGKRVVAEALSRGHVVTAVVRDPARIHDLPEGVGARTGDAGNVEDVAALSIGQDVVVSATRPAAGHESDLVTTAKALLAGLDGAGARLLVVGGAATLTIPGGDGATVLDDPRYLPVAARSIALACVDQLDVLRGDGGTDWTYLSPPALLQPGERTGTYRVGGDELLVDAEGNSMISMEDLAVALLDEAEHPAHRRVRFTVAY